MIPAIRRFAVAAALLIGAALLLAPGVRADEAKDTFRQGTIAYEAGDFAGAADLFRRAYQLRASWKMLFNIGQAETAAKRYGLALEAFEAYLVQGGDDIKPERRDQVLAEIQRMRLLVGVLEVTADPGAALFVDGVQRGVAPFDGVTRVEAGSHRVELRRDGVVLLDRTVSIAGGLTTSIDGRAASAPAPVAKAAPEEATAPEEAKELAVEQPIEESPPAAPVAPERKRTKLIAGVVLGGAGLVGLGVGVGFAVKGGKDYDEYLAARDSGDRTTFEDYENEVLPRDRAAMGAGLAIGAALVVAGVALVALDMREGADEPEGAVSLRPELGGLGVSF